MAGGAEIDLMLAAVEPKVWLSRDDVRGPESRFATLLDGAPVTASDARPDDLAVVIFTSGSTGGPKAALHTQRSLAYKGRMMAKVHGLRRRDVVLMPAPIAHVSGLLNGVLVPGAAPFTSYLVERWDTARALDTIERERVSFMIGPTTFFVGLMHDPGFSPEKVASLRLVSSGGGGVSAAFVEEASRVLGCRVKRTYGSTEAPTTATSGARDSRRRAAETDGRAIGAVELRATDPETHREVPPGETGELWVQGPELFSGYAVAEQTAAAITDGLVPHRRPRHHRRRRLAHDRRAHQGHHHPRRREHLGRRGGAHARGPSRRHARPSRSATPTTGSASGCARSSLASRPVRPRHVPGLVRGAGRGPVQDAGAGRRPRRVPAARRGQARPQRPPPARRCHPDP